MLKNRYTYIVGAIILLLITAGVYFALKSDEADPEVSEDDLQVTMVNTSDDGQKDEQSENTNDSTEEETEEAERPENPKTPILSGNVTEKPIVSSSFGLVPQVPIEQGQLVSTSCDSEPGVECVIELTNSDSKQKIIFEVKTTSSVGNAVWEWVGGEDVPSGTWSTVAKAGDKTSNVEVIYVQ